MKTLRLAVILFPIGFVVGLIVIPARAQADITLTLTATSRQIVISYTAPNTSPCTVEVSEDPSYTPVVNDVNVALFASGNSDSRSGALGAGTTSRTFVAGTFQQPNGVTPLVAIDGKTYPRVLKVNTTHYIRVTCGTHTGTGSIATVNRPLGITYDEPMPTTAAGVYGFPTLDATNRNEQTIDPQFGTVLRKISITADNSFAGSGSMEFNENGAQWPWTTWPGASTTINDGSGNVGYLAQLLTTDSFTRLYWVNTTTGVSRHLGYMQLPSGTSGYSSNKYVHALSSLSGTDPRKVFSVFLDDSNEAHVWQCLLPASGNSYYKQSVPADGTTASCTWSDLTSGTTLTDKMVAFDATYDPTKFSAFFYTNVQGDYLVFAAARRQQNTYSWVGVYQISTNTVVALAPMYLRAGNAGSTNQRWCGYHTSQPLLNSTNRVSWENHDLIGGSGAGSGGTNGYITTLTGSINSAVTSLVLASNTPVADVTDTTLGAFAAGDEIWIDSENMILVSNTSGTTWTVLRAQAGTVAAAHTSGANVRAGCRCHASTDFTNASIMMWDFLADPTGTSVAANNDGINGHQSGADDRKIGSGWVTCATSAIASCPSPLVASNSPSFGGVTKNYGGNAGMMHAAAAHQINASSGERVWGDDFIHPYSDPEAIPSSVTNVTGTLFKVTLPVTVDIKTLPIVAVLGTHRGLDASNPTLGNTIGGLSADNYKYCIAYKAGECRVGSSAGDIYVNGPNLSTSSTCPSDIAPTNTTSSALCIFNGAGSGTENLLQIGLTEAYSNGKYLRALTHGLAGYKQIGAFANGQASPNGNWIAFLVWGTDGNQNVWQVKAPPFPTYDSINRNTFQQTAVSVSALAGADNAIIEFGYNPSFNCASRNEVCVSATSNAPYFFASDTFTGVGCASGCTLNIPVIPDRVAYYRIKWRNGSTLVATSVTTATGGTLPPTPAHLFHASSD